jgi:hypothetical protein
VSRGQAGGATVLRAVSSVVTFWALVTIGIFFVGDAAARGRLDVALRAGAVLAFVGWCAWVFLVRMSVRVDASALTARNLLRWVRIPWGRIRDVERRAQLRVTLDDGTTVECWGSPFAPRAGGRGGQRAATTPALTASNTPWGQPLGGTAELRRGPSADSALVAVRAAWQASHGETGPVTRGWDVPALIVGAVLAVCALFALLPW